jgi:hypothetical protein
MESSWSPHNLLKVLMDSSWSPGGVFMESSCSPCGVSVDSLDSMRTPPKIHRFYGESMNFGHILAESLKSVIHNEKITII